MGFCLSPSVGHSLRRRRTGPQQVTHNAHVVVPRNVRCNISLCNTEIKNPSSPSRKRVERAYTGERDGRQYQYELRGMAHRGLWKQLVNRVDALEGDERLVAFAASLAQNAGELVVVSTLFKRMRKRGVAPGAHSYSVMLKGLARMRAGPATVDAMVNEIVEDEQVAFDSILLNSVADAYVRAGSFDDAFRFSKRYPTLRNVRTFNILIRGLVRRNDLDAAFQMVEEMRELGIEPNDVTRNTLIDGCAKSGRYERAWQLAAELSPKTGDGPNSLRVALTSMLMSHAEAGRLSEALGLLRELEKKQTTSSGITYAALIKACLQNGRVKAAEKILSSMPDNAFERISAYNALVSGLCKLEKPATLERAFALVNEMKTGTDFEIRPTSETYNELLDGLVKQQKYERAEEVITSMEHLADVVSYSVIIRGYGAAGDANSAKRAFARMVRTGIRPDVIALNTLINACCRGDDIAFATRILEEMEADRLLWKMSAASYSPLIAAHGRGRRFDESWGMYLRMKENGVKTNSFVCSMMANIILVFARDIVREGRSAACTELAKRCAVILRDSCDVGVDITIVRKWRRTMLLTFGKKTHLSTALRGTNLTGDVESASERIFKNHGWNNVDSGWRFM